MDVLTLLGAGSRRRPATVCDRGSGAVRPDPGTARGTLPPEDDLCAPHVVALGHVGGQFEPGEGDEHVAHLPAGPTDQVVVRPLDVRVEADGPGTEVERGDLTQFRQVVQSL